MTYLKLNKMILIKETTLTCFNRNKYYIKKS